MSSLKVESSDSLSQELVHMNGVTGVIGMDNIIKRFVRAVRNWKLWRAVIASVLKSHHRSNVVHRHEVKKYIESVSKFAAEICLLAHARHFSSSSLLDIYKTIIRHCFDY